MKSLAEAGLRNSTVLLETGLGLDGNKGDFSWESDGKFGSLSMRLRTLTGLGTGFGEEEANSEIENIATCQSTKYHSPMKGHGVKRHGIRRQSIKCHSV